MYKDASSKPRPVEEPVSEKAKADEAPSQTVDPNEPWKQAGLSNDQRIAYVIRTYGTKISNNKVFEISGVSEKEHWRPSHARVVERFDPKLLDLVIPGEITLARAYELVRAARYHDNK